MKIVSYIALSAMLLLPAPARGKSAAEDVAPVHTAARYLVEACDATGRFRYRINTAPSIRVKPRYNILRHAGTIYALCMYEDRYPHPLTRAAIARATGFLERNAIGGVASSTNMLAVWSRPAINLGSAPVQAKLGGTGLGLVALTSALRLGIVDIDRDTLRKLAAFVRYLQTEDGRIISKYIPSEGGRYDLWASLYYPGEAALGLIMLYEIDPNPAWLDSARNALLYLARERRDSHRRPADHWALLATHRLLRLPRNREHKDDDQLLELHTAQLCRSIIAARAPNTRRVGLTGDGRTCPSATRLEGLIAALPLLNDPLLRARSRHAIDQGIAFLLLTQLREGPYRGAWPRAAAPVTEDHPAYTPSFNRRATEVRIDYVQHALAALLMYETIVRRY